MSKTSQINLSMSCPKAPRILDSDNHNYPKLKIKRIISNLSRDIALYTSKLKQQHIVYIIIQVFKIMFFYSF